MPGTVLLVDDDDDTRMLLAEGLRRRGFDVRDAGSGKACLRYVADADVDVVVTDLEMPGLSGVELMDQLRTRHPNILTLMLTGHATVATAVEAVRAGAYDYLTKPAKLDRDRGADPLELAKHFMERICARNRKPVPTLDPTAARKLVDYAWPGNVRELENTIERALALCSGELVTTVHLPRKVVEFEPQRLELPTDPTQLFTLDEMERRYVRQVLAATRGNKTHAARILGIDRRSLYRRLEYAEPAPSK